MKLRVAYFVHDLSDAAVSRRVQMLVQGGARVTVIGFRRSANPPASLHGAALIDLGVTRDAALTSRALSVAKAMTKLKRLKSAVRDLDVIIARNLEMLALARHSQKLSGSKASLVYECLDIHRLLSSKGIAGRSIRAVETALWKRVDRLITSSPAFVRNYFRPRGFQAPIAILENKVLETSALPRPFRSRPAAQKPWRIGLFGILRCRKSFDILADLAKSANGSVQIVIRGKPSRVVFPDFEALVASSPFVEFAGSYRNPENLADIYADVHFAWAIDFYEEGENSAWLLPNRLYEGSYFGAVPLALSGVETGAWLKKHDAGVLFGPSLARELKDFFNALDRSAYEKLASAVRRIPREELVDDSKAAEAFVKSLADKNTITVSGAPAAAAAVAKAIMPRETATPDQTAAELSSAKAGPCVSIIMANYNGASFIGDAIDSVLRQTTQDFELIVADDASRDDSVSIARRYAARDKRVKLVESSQNTGPAGARNRGLSAASGEWIAVMDSDDVMHPARLERLLAVAARDGANIVADDMAVFYSDASKPTHGLLSGRYAEAPFWVGVPDYIRLNTFYSSGGPGLGYLKPLIKRDLIEETGVRYDSSLRVGEDYDLILHLLQQGAKYRVHPQQLYYYRKHRASVSHRLSSEAAQAILEADLRFQGRLEATDQELSAALAARIRSVRLVLAFNELIGALKSKRFLAASALVLAKPRLLPLLQEPAAAAIARLKAKIQAAVQMRRPLSLNRGSQ
jgi:GT2 family glycosyltransferase